MKIIIKYIVFFIILNANSQIITGKIIDSVGNPISLANISYTKKNIGTSSNSKGVFSLKKINEGNILISSLGYNDKIINITDFINRKDTLKISLSIKTERLDEVLISSKKIKYSRLKELGLKRDFLKIKTRLPIGYEYSCLIKNPYKKRGKIQSVILDLSKVKLSEYLVHYNIKFYRFNKLEQKPGKLIYDKNIIVKPENKSYKLKIDVSNLSIPFLKNGVCVGIEILKSDSEPVSKSTTLSPRFNFTLTKGRKILTWSRYRNKEWLIKTTKAVFSKNKYINGRINLKVKIEK